MRKHPGAYKGEKRRKELERKRQQDKKRLKRQSSRQPAESPEAPDPQAGYSGTERVNVGQ